MIVEINLDLVGFALLRSIIVLLKKKFAPCSEPIIRQTKTSHDLVSRAFPRFPALSRAFPRFPALSRAFGSLPVVSAHRLMTI